MAPLPQHRGPGAGAPDLGMDLALGFECTSFSDLALWLL